jgi:hypothetical protein
MSAEEQAQRLTALPMDEWRKPFDKYRVIADQHPAEADIDTLSDAELDAIVHEVRSEMLGKQK